MLRTVLRLVATRVPLLDASCPHYAFHSSSILSKSAGPSKPKKIEEADIDEAFLKGSGPGGQKINKTSSAVQLKHIPSGIVVKVQQSRSRDLNRTIARKKLAEQLDLAKNGEESWIHKKQDIKAKRKAKASQRSRVKYRRLEAEKVDTKITSSSETVAQAGRTRLNEKAVADISDSNEVKGQNPTV